MPGAADKLRFPEMPTSSADEPSVCASVRFKGIGMGLISSQVASLKKWFWPTIARRLEAEIPAFDLYLDREMKAGKPGEWRQSAKAAVAEAREALGQNRFVEALIAFDCAKREEIPSLTKEEVRLRAISLIHESERLDDLTRDTIREILQNKTHSITAAELTTATHSITAAELTTAIHLRDDDRLSTFLAMRRLSRHLQKLSGITFLVLLGVITLARFHVVFCNTPILLGVMCFGALGAAVSMMLSITPTAGLIPSQLPTGVLLLARPLFGASAAVAVYVFIEMGVLGRPYHTDFTYLGLAFAAGFSDQLLLSAVSKAATSSRESGQGKRSQVLGLG
jgi:hypothetical protein